ncbi:alkaline phosphatase D family protein [Yinghuangia sp. YIM S09857]|uniref:alkaline phosphatase D family protein n=1 Tax=Yinghuangia sp. YIM S09857 TaxID=3436929 RepID=UPI003F5379BB
MADLVLGPALRYAGRTTATVWVETDGPGSVRVECDDAAGEAATWSVFGRHYAIVVVDGLAPARTRPYRVLLDGRQVWPPHPAVFPPSVIRTAGDDAEPRRIAFGSCRWSRPPNREEPDERHLDPDVLDTFATRLAGGTPDELPDALLLLGDQVYADEISVRMRDRLAARRDISRPPGPQVADYHEYALLYHESWGDPQIRWLLSTVPSAMIFDDHEIVDDWNTSHTWRTDMAALPWWPERIGGAFASYWVYQHLGNLDPGALAADETYAKVRDAADPAQAEEILRAFALRADADAGNGDRDHPRAWWSYRRDFGRTRLVMLDTRAGRVLTPKDRHIISSGELAWAEEQFDEGGYDHLLIGSSLPWLLPHAIHDLESWNEALCAGARGPRIARISEKVRRAGDLEHWAAFRESFAAFTGVLERIAADGPRAEGRPPATIAVLSGDVHHAYAAEADWPAHETTATNGKEPQRPARVVQFTCSPLHNAVPVGIRFGFRLGWGAVATRIGALLARHAKLPPRPVRWTKLGGPWFGNHLMSLTLHGREAELALDRAMRPRGGGDPWLRRIGTAKLR